MDITELEEVAGIERRRLRYVLDHELVLKQAISACVVSDGFGTDFGRAVQVGRDV